MAEGTHSSGPGVKRRGTRQLREDAKRQRQEDYERQKREEEKERHAKFEIFRTNITKLSAYLWKDDFHQFDREEWGQLCSKVNAADKRYETELETDYSGKIKEVQDTIKEQENKIQKLTNEIRELECETNPTEGDKKRKDKTQQDLQMLQHTQGIQKRNLSAWIKKNNKSSETSLQKALEGMKDFIETNGLVRIPTDHNITDEEMATVKNAIKKSWEQ